MDRQLENRRNSINDRLLDWKRRDISRNEEI